MAIIINPFRIHSGWVCHSHGLRVLMLRSSQRFWVAYKGLLELNSKRESDVKDLKLIMDKMGIVPKEKRRISEKLKNKVLLNVAKDFDSAMRELDEMFEGLSDITLADSTLMFKAVKELKKMYHHMLKVEHIPDYMRQHILNSMHSLMHLMKDVQYHTWLSSKAHSRERMKVNELTFISSRGERRRIRIQTLELDHMRDRIDPLKRWVMKLKKLKTHDDVHELHTKITELLEQYHEEVNHIRHILHESHVLTRRTEKLFKAIEHEANSLGSKVIAKMVLKYAVKFHSLHRKLEAQARREYFDIDHIVSALPSPTAALKKEHKAKVISMDMFRKKKHEAAKPAEVKKAA
ncbi:hypothetical protein KY359_06180 [Candidatus Woesearchaeota archaeon]|nr:hypothetical protein [Candidatus Woesearchaeota archaeon]